MPTVTTMMRESGMVAPKRSEGATIPALAAASGSGPGRILSTREVTAKAKSRRFTAAYKRHVLKEAD